ncbi:MAG: ZIP family metal transporter [Gammaproteobacteria bacterium]|nr:ZIP family metal transporter [Gammaproteobacteria bacterium]
MNLKVLLALSIFLTILIAGFYPFKKKKCATASHGISIGETLATGVFLGAGLLHMLPDAALLFDRAGHHYPFAYLITGAVFLLFLWFEHVGQVLYHPPHATTDHVHHEHDHHATHPAFAVLAWAMLSIHSFILGTALGINHSESIIIMLFLAIITHKWAESFALAIQLNQSTLRPFSKYGLFFLFACMTPAGIFLGCYFDNPTYNSLTSPILIAASAGTFLYLGTLHGLERCVLVERCCNLADFSFVIIGFLLMAAVAVYL